VGRAALKTASSKMTKYEKACSDNQHVFIFFAFDIFNFLTPEAVNLLKRIQNVMHSKFQRLDFVIQKSLTAQIVGRLPFIHV
jgi:hypothetical protein